MFPSSVDISTVTILRCFNENFIGYWYQLFFDRKFNRQAIDGSIRIVALKASSVSGSMYQSNSLIQNSASLLHIEAPYA